MKLFKSKSKGPTDKVPLSDGGYPMQFIELAEDGSLQVTVDAMNTLEGQQNRKISVVTFCGPQSTGKSFLANRIIG